MNPTHRPMQTKVGVLTKSLLMIKVVSMFEALMVKVEMLMILPMALQTVVFQPRRRLPRKKRLSLIILRVGKLFRLQTIPKPEI